MKLIRADELVRKMKEFRFNSATISIESFVIDKFSDAFASEEEKRDASRMKTAYQTRYAVIKNCCGDEWMIGVYDSPESAFGAVLMDAFKWLEETNVNLKDGETHCQLTLSSEVDHSHGAFTEITAKYSETSWSCEIEDKYRVFLERGEKP